MSRILLVEDDAALRTSVRQILERSGYEVRVAADGGAGVRELQTGVFEVVLLDIGLPFVDGWRILQTLEGKRLPSVIVTARVARSATRCAHWTWGRTTTWPSLSAPRSC